MSSNVTSSCAWRLYVIIDPAATRGRDLTEVATAAIRGGADVIQLRDKLASARQFLEEAKRILAVTRAAGVPLIINDRVDVACVIEAAGVHVGQDDVSITEARAILRPEQLVGKSTHSLEQALVAEREGANYIGLGPIFPTPTKPNYGSLGLAVIQQVASAVRVPIICIGGIDRDTVEYVIQAGARCIAVVRAVCSAPDSEAAAKELKQKMLAQSDRPNVCASL